eukprot:scaffold10.g2303.t1
MHSGRRALVGLARQAWAPLAGVEALSGSVLHAGLAAPAGAWSQGGDVASGSRALSWAAGGSGLAHVGPAAAAAPAAAPAAAAQRPEQQQQQQQEAAAAAAARWRAAAPVGRPDPFSLVRAEIECVTERMRRDLFTDIPALERAAEYFFRAGAEGKRLRSSILLLMASALSAAPVPSLMLTVDEGKSLGALVRRAGACRALSGPPPAEHPETQRRRQQRVAEITELIHVASLLHDDVIDNANTRRGMKALNTVAILAGDFLLARASVTLASLRNSEVLEHLVAGEILQLTADPEEALSMDHYLRKTFFKTASLMANSCKSVAILGGYPADVCQDAWDYGRHLGLAFQLVDDVMDFTSTAAEMGKPALNDLRSGLATAPVLFAAQARGGAAGREGHGARLGAGRGARLAAMREAAAGAWARRGGRPRSEARMPWHEARSRAPLLASP